MCFVRILEKMFNYAYFVSVLIDRWPDFPFLFFSRDSSGFITFPFLAIVHIYYTGPFLCIFPYFGLQKWILGEEL